MPAPDALPMNSQSRWRLATSPTPPRIGSMRGAAYSNRGSRQTPSSHRPERYPDIQLDLIDEGRAHSPADGPLRVGTT